MSSTYLWGEGINWSKDSSDYAPSTIFNQKYPARTIRVKSSVAYSSSTSGEYFTIENLSNIATSVSGLIIVINTISNYGNYEPTQIQLKMGSPYSSGSWYTSGYRNLTEVLGGAYDAPVSPAVTTYYDESYIRGPTIGTMTGSTDSKMIIRVHGGYPGDYCRPTIETTQCVSSASIYPIVQRTYGSLPGTYTGFQGIRIRISNNWFGKIACYATTD